MTLGLEVGDPCVNLTNTALDAIQKNQPRPACVQLLINANKDANVCRHGQHNLYISIPIKVASECIYTL